MPQGSGRSGLPLNRKFILHALPALLFLLWGVLYLRNGDLSAALGVAPDSDATRWWRWGLETLLWVAGAALLQQFFRFVIYDRVVARAIGGPVPEVLKALTGVLVYLVTATLVVGLVYERSVMGFLAALGASGVVLGFALRSLIADVFTGLAINLDRSFVIGDWVQVNEGVSGVVIGQIREIGWRCTSLQTEEKTIVVIPNGLLGLERMVNITRPPSAKRYEFSVTVEFSVPPARVKRVLMAALTGLDDTPGFDTGIAPVVLIEGTSSLGVEYLLRYWIHPWEPVSPTTAEDHVYSAVLANLHTAGIALAYPKRDIYTANMPTRQFDDHRTSDLAKLLGETDLFSPLSRDDLADLAAKMVRDKLPAGKTLVREGARGKSLYILIEGLLDVFVDTDHGEERVGRIHPGECFGEMSLLTGERRSATIRPAVESVVYEVRKKAVRELMERRPALADILARLLAERQLGTELALHQSEEDHQHEQVEGFASQLVSRMREFLEIRLHPARHDDEP